MLSPQTTCPGTGVDAAFVPAVGASLLTVEFFSLQLFLGVLLSLFTYSWRLFAYSWSFLAYSVNMLLLNTPKDRKQKRSSVGKTALIVSKKTSFKRKSQDSHIDP